MENFKKVTICDKRLKNLYLISDAGRVFSLQKNRFIKGSDNGSGYKFVELKNNNFSQKIYIHRLVALHYIKNIDKKPFINHIDCNPANNSKENLEWVTNEENIKYAARLGKFKKNEAWKNKIALNQPNRTFIKSVDVITGEEEFFESINSAMKKGYQASCISQCCNGIRKTHKGKYWFNLEKTNEN